MIGNREDSIGTQTADSDVDAAGEPGHVGGVLDEEGVADAIEVEQVSEESDWDFTDLALVRVEDE